MGSEMASLAMVLDNVITSHLINKRDDIRHVHLEFLVNVDRAAETSIADCASGLARDPEELSARPSRSGRTPPPRSCSNSPGSEAPSPPITVLTPRRLPRLAHHHRRHIRLGLRGFIRCETEMDRGHFTLDGARPGDLDRPYLNGVRIFVGQGGDFESCEVKINDSLHEPSTAALASMNWPRTEQMSTAKAFLLLVHPAQTRKASADQISAPGYTRHFTFRTYGDTRPH